MDRAQDINMGRVGQGKDQDINMGKVGQGQDINKGNKDKNN